MFSAGQIFYRGKFEIRGTGTGSKNVTARSVNVLVRFKFFKVSLIASLPFIVKTKMIRTYIKILPKSAPHQVAHGV